jgi:uncharacterized cupin superfamily protein
MAWAAANENARILYKSSDGAIEVGIRRWQQRNTAFFWERDILCYFMRGHGFLRRDTDGSIEVTPETAVHFKEGWRGDSGPGVGVVAYLSAALIRSSEK